MAYMKAVRRRIKANVKSRLSRIDHLTDTVLIRKLREQASCLKLLKNTHIYSSLLTI